MAERSATQSRGNGHDAPLAFSRRWFLKGVGLAAGSAGLPTLAGAQDAASPAPGLTLLGRDAREIELTVNGQTDAVTVEPRTTLLAALRDGLGLTGTKEICDRGACGGCSVLLDGVAVNSCMTLAMDAVGREVTTVEGIAADPACADLIQSFCENDAAQCGFCIPGFVVRARELLQSNPRPTFEEIRAGLSGNLCRCGTYSKIFDAVLAASGQEVARREENDVALENEHARVDIRAKVGGEVKFTADIQRPGMLFAKHVRFPYGAGRVVDSDVEAARAVPGVIEVEMGASEARFPGARVGHVVGESIDAVEDAIEALNLRVRQGAARTDPTEFYEGVPPLGAEQQRTLDEAFEGAAAIVEANYSTQVQTHSSLETHGGVVDHRGDSAEAWGSTQACMGYREGLTDPCGLRQDQITFHCEHVGGGFGSKFSPGPTGRLAAEVSRRHGRPCRVMLDRREEHLDSGNRPGSIQHMRVAADADGRILGSRIHCVSTVGFQEGGGGVSNPMVYDFGDFERTEDEIILSSGLPTPFRAPGNPQGCFAVESMMDELAATLGVDPLEIRRTNGIGPRRERMMDHAAQVFGWNRRRPDGSSPGRIRTGMGMGAGHWHAWGNRCQIDVDIYPDGRVEVRSGTQDIGTGNRTVLVDVAADQLGIGRSLITGLCGCTDYPPGPASGGSVTARLVATTTRDAAERAKVALIAEVAAAWSVEAGDVECEDGRFSERGGNRTADWSDACALMRTEKISERGSFNRDYVGGGDPSEQTSAVQFAEVEVDTETGVVRVKRIVASQACGQPVNRLTVENQICGGVAQGISFALFEERVLDRPTGGMLNPNLEWYRIAGSADVPEIIPLLDWEEGETGVRSIGEPTTIPTAGAIANAVANAIGVRVYDLPITPARVLAALERGGRS